MREILSGRLLTPPPPHHHSPLCVILSLSCKPVTAQYNPTVGYSVISSLRFPVPRQISSPGKDGEYPAATARTRT